MSTRLLLLLFSPLLWGYLPAQVNIWVDDCSNLSATKPPGGVSTGTYVWVLEKQVAPEIWSQKRKKPTKTGAAQFPNLPNGTVGCTVRILDITGHEVAQSTFFEKEVMFPLTGIPDGFYTLSFEVKGRQTYTERVVILRKK